jgi:hypothetical protein
VNYCSCMLHFIYIITFFSLICSVLWSDPKSIKVCLDTYKFWRTKVKNMYSLMGLTGEVLLLLAYTDTLAELQYCISVICTVLTDVNCLLGEMEEGRM